MILNGGSISMHGSIVNLYQLFIHIYIYRHALKEVSARNLVNEILGEKCAFILDKFLLLPLLFSALPPILNSKLCLWPENDIYRWIDLIMRMHFAFVGTHLNESQCHCQSSSPRGFVFQQPSQFVNATVIKCISRYCIATRRR